MLPDIDCAFTFVRHPLDRIISGFYTILSMLDREFSHQSNGNKAEKQRIEEKYSILHYGYNKSEKIISKVCNRNYFKKL